LADSAKLAEESSILRRTGFCSGCLVAAEELNFQVIVIEYSGCSGSNE
jgi:hypothetical protein